MRELKTVLVMVSPLLADLIRYVAESRIKQPHARLSIIAQISDLAHLPRELRDMKPDLVIFGPASEAAQRAAASMTARFRVLTLSANLSSVSGPGAEDIDSLTLDTLTRRLRDILQEI